MKVFLSALLVLSSLGFPDVSSAARGDAIATCGMAFLRDEGSTSIWRAVYPTTVFVTIRSTGAGVIYTLNKDDELRIELPDQTAACY
jgi:hypothetical protein